MAVIELPQECPRSLHKECLHTFMLSYQRRTQKCNFPQTGRNVSNKRRQNHKLCFIESNALDIYCFRARVTKN